MGRLSQKWKLGHLVVVHRCIICTAYVPLCSAWNTSLLLSVHYTKNWRMHKFTPIGILSIHIILHICILYILVVLQMHDSCWPLCTCHEWQKYSQSFSVGQRKKANKQPCNKRENNMLDWLKFLRKCLTSRRQEKVEVAEMYSVGGVKVAQTRFSSNRIIKTYKVHHNAPGEWWVRFQPS